MRTGVRSPTSVSRRSFYACYSFLKGIARREIGGDRQKQVATLLYGSGLRLLEALQLRVKDLDFGRDEIVVRRGKGAQDRITMMADSVQQALTGQLERVRRQHARDLAGGDGYVPLPGAYHRKSPSSARKW